MASGLTPRERFTRIMRHQPADRVPLDLGGCSLTSADARVLDGMAQQLGIEGGAVLPDNTINETLLQALDVDFRPVGSLIGGKRWLQGDRMVDIWGIERAWTGDYWDIVHSPLRGAVIEDLDAFPWPDPKKIVDEAPLEEYRRRARYLHEHTNLVVVGEHPVYGVFELACWMCGFDDILWRMAGDKPFVLRLFNILLKLQKAFIEPYYQAIGPYIDLTTSGDDFGMQTGPFIAPAAFRELIAPFFSERIALTRSLTPAYFWHHTCGSVYDLIPDLLSCGVQILNPIQPGAYKMEPERLKTSFGSRVTFHGGFDTQEVLPHGTPEQIEAEVIRVMHALKPDGGYIFSAAHNIQHDVPPQHVLQMLNAARKHGEYSQIEENQ